LLYKEYVGNFRRKHYSTLTIKAKYTCLKELCTVVFNFLTTNSGTLDDVNLSL
jgi:hypothetical protein